MLGGGLVMTDSDERSALGLAERRAVRDYMDKTFPERLRAITDAAGFAVPVEVEWHRIALPGEAAAYGSDNFWTNIYFVPLAEALKSIAADEIGKQALAERLTKIIVLYDKATAPTSAYENGVSFDAGELKINFQPHSNARDIKARADAIRKALEAKL